MNKENYANRLVQYLKKSHNPMNSEIKNLIENENLWWASKGNARYLLNFQQKVIWYFPYGFRSISKNTALAELAEAKQHGHFLPMTENNIDQLNNNKWSKRYISNDKRWFIVNKQNDLIMICLA